MEQGEKLLSEKRKMNMKTHSIHKMLTADLLFYYGIKFLFLTQIKNLTAGDIIIASAFFGIFRAIFQVFVTMLIEKLGEKKGLIFADLVNAFSVILVMLSSNLSILILANLFSAVGYSARDISEARNIKSFHTKYRKQRKHIFKD